MRIPKEVKVGGKTYRVEITDRLDMGRLNASAEINYIDLVIRIVPQHPQKMEADFLHELTHAVRYHLGYTDQDEKEIDELAQALYMVITDNPGIFSTPAQAGPRRKGARHGTRKH